MRHCQATGCKAHLTKYQRRWCKKHDAETVCAYPKCRQKLKWNGQRYCTKCKNLVLAQRSVKKQKGFCERGYEEYITHFNDGGTKTRSVDFSGRSCGASEYIVAHRSAQKDAQKTNHRRIYVTG